MNSNAGVHALALLMTAYKRAASAAYYVQPTPFIAISLG
jgi:hypothetical protein